MAGIKLNGCIEGCSGGWFYYPDPAGAVACWNCNPGAVHHVQPAAPAPVADGGNPKDAIGSAKAPLSCIPRGPLHELGLAMMEGARKYGRHNYRVSPIRASVYLDAAERHLSAWWEGENIDPDSGLPHLSKAMACLVILRDASMTGGLLDDRPPALPAGWLADLNARAADLVARYPAAPPPVTQAG